MTSAAPFRIVAGTTMIHDTAAQAYRDFQHKHDPIFAAIRDHRSCTAVHTEAVEIEFASEGKVTKRAYAKLQEETGDACTDMFAAARLLLQTQPTTVFGAIALLRYLESLFGEDESGVDVPSFPDDVGGDWWHLVLVRTLASALTQVSAMSNVVQFPYCVARRAHARRPRKSKNGTPEERAAKAQSSRSCGVVHLRGQDRTEDAETRKFRGLVEQIDPQHLPAVLAFMRRFVSQT